MFRSDVSQVRVDAQAVDRNNKPITGLGVEDFVLFEHGREQPIRGFSTEDTPIDVLLLIDVSGSMESHVQRLADASAEAMMALGREDRVAAMVFDRRTRVRMGFRKARDGVQRELYDLLERESFNGGTDITRGLLDAADYVRREARPEARRAIVILTDDRTERGRDEAGVLRALTRADAVLCALITPDAMRSVRRGGGSWPNGPWGGVWGRRGPVVIGGGGLRSAGTEEIARESGGDSLRVDDASALERTLERLRQRYAIYFNLPPDVAAGQERDIEVRLSDAALRRYPGAEVRFRRVYIAPEAGVPAPVSSESDVITQRRPERKQVEILKVPPEQVQTQKSCGGGWRRVDEPACPPASK